MSDTRDLASLSGLDQLRLMANGRIPPAPIAASLGFALDELEAGRVTFVGAPTLAMYNPIGSVHGGWMATLLDSACGCAAHSMLRPGQTYVTLELKTAFHRTLRADTPVVCEGRIVQIGGRAAFSEAELKGEDGTLYATATSTCLVMTN